MNRLAMRADDAPAYICGRRPIEQWEDRAIDGYADQRHHCGTIAADLCVQQFPALDVFPWKEGIGTGTRPRNQVGKGKAPLRQPLVTLLPDQVRHQTTTVQRVP